MQSKLNRRNILIGASAAAIAAGAPAAASIHVDAQLMTLLALEKELIVAKAHSDAVMEDNSRISEEADLIAGPRPMHPYDWERFHKPEMPQDLKEMNHDVVFATPIGELWAKDDRFESRLPEPLRVWNARVEAEKEKVQSEWDDYRARHNEAIRKVGYNDDRFGESYQDCVDIAHRMFEIPANSVEAMAVKVRAAEILGWFNGVEPDEEFYDSLVDDVKRLAARERSPNDVQDRSQA